MHICENERYQEMLDRFHRDFPYWEELGGKTLFISGASGMIGSFLVDAIMRYNQKHPAAPPCAVIAAGRNRRKGEERFAPWLASPAFDFVEHDVSAPLEALPWEPDYWIHGASTSHPIAYATQPVSTILTNVLGTHHLLEAAARNPGSRFLLLSSVEIYGQNRGDTEYCGEDYCGYLDCNTLRAGYPEGKRVSEALCQAYIAQEGVDAVTIRFPRCYGPTMGMEDSKAIAQFIKNGVRGEDIVLKSEGQQHYSFAHVSDAVLGLLWVLVRGERGQAYNLADRRSDITQRALAERIAAYSGTRVVFELPDAVERRGYSTATKALLNGEKLRALGWEARYDIDAGIRETIDILRDLDRERACTADAGRGPAACEKT